MGNSLYISTTEAGSGKALVALGILSLILRKTPNISFFRPVVQNKVVSAIDIPQRDEDIELIRQHFHLPQTYDESFGLLSTQVNDWMGQQQNERVIETVIEKYKVLESRSDFILCEGSDYRGKGNAFEFNLNQEIAKNLGCPILILGNADNRNMAEALHPVQIAMDTYQKHHCRIAGIVLNKAAPEQVEKLTAALAKRYADFGYGFGVIPYEPKLMWPRVKDIARQLQAQILYGHGHLDNLASNFLVVAMQLQHALPWLSDDSLIITPGDRADVIIAMLQAHQSSKYSRLAGLLLSTGFKPDPAIARLIEGLPEVLPILSVKSDTYGTVSQIEAMQHVLQPDDQQKIELSSQLFERYVDVPLLEAQLSLAAPQELTPRMFTYNLMQQAKANPQHIVLPESTDPRILQAAAALRSRQLVEITLLGQLKPIEQVIKHYGIPLNLDDATLLNPVDSYRLDEYARCFYELRQHKGATLDIAYDYMLDATYFGTMMVYQGDAAGMVSGAVHTTQHTIRPALQLIKAQPGVERVSSVFLMYLEDHVRVYGDCAVIPNPDAQQLAEIALLSAETAQSFGIDPRVALLSYSSGDSGVGVDVEKVRQATHIAQARRPELIIEGPIQYDAAVDPTVAARKLPDSKLGGRATVLVFPDLNTGNNTYKAVQRETGAIAIGPILQGLKKPVNDLSRGCTVDDVINTILITAIQAQAICLSNSSIP